MGGKGPRDLKKYMIRVRTSAESEGRGEKTG